MVAVRLFLTSLAPSWKTKATIWKILYWNEQHSSLTYYFFSPHTMFFTLLKVGWGAFCALLRKFFNLFFCVLFFNLFLRFHWTYFRAILLKKFFTTYVGTATLKETLSYFLILIANIVSNCCSMVLNFFLISSIYMYVPTMKHFSQNKTACDIVFVVGVAVK